MKATKRATATKIYYIFDLEAFFSGEEAITPTAMTAESAEELSEYYDGRIEIYTSRREAERAERYYNTIKF